MLYCHHCGARFYTAHNRPNYVMYVHNYSFCHFSRKWSARRVNTWFWETLAPLLRLSEKDIQRIAGKTKQSDKADTAAEIRRLEESLTRLEESRIDGTIRRETYNHKVSDITRRLGELKAAPKDAARLSPEKRAEMMRDLVAVLQVGEELNPAKVNAILRAIFDRVTLDAEGVIRLEPRKGMEVFFAR